MNPFRTADLTLQGVYADESSVVRTPTTAACNASPIWERNTATTTATTWALRWWWSPGRTTTVPLVVVVLRTRHLRIIR